MEDVRLRPYRNIYDKFHPWSPPTQRDQWERERQSIRRRVLVSNGLWPLPDRTSLQPRFGQTIQRDQYTIQHVMFRSRPGHYVTGVLYRPTKQATRVPGVLCPHGHWSDGRFYDAGPSAKGQLESGAETIPEAARYPLQARCVQLARMGCVVLHYDMIGYADSTAIEHRQGFNDADALLWLTNKMGLQTWNSICAVDFIESLEEVDPTRIAVTGASGGGTQTFILGAVDDRPAVAFPAVMVSTSMQGGCVCENASYLRVGLNNVALAAAFAPRPLAMSGADDWTIDIERVGLPELRQVYSLYGRPSQVTARTWPQFKHNYNSHSRQMMYHWFNRHLSLGLTEPIVEASFEPVTKEEQSVWSSIERPGDFCDADRLRKAMREVAQQQLADLLEPSAGGEVGRYRAIVGAAASVMLASDLRRGDAVTVGQPERIADGLSEFRVFRSLREGGRHVIRCFVSGKTAAVPRESDVVLWLDGEGGQALSRAPAFQEAAAVPGTSGGTVLTMDYFGQGLPAERLAARGQVDANYGGLTYCYNQPLLSERVRDVATVLHALQARGNRVRLVATGSAGPVALLAAATCPELVTAVTADLNGFHFGTVVSPGDEMMLPGAMRYGDIGGLAALVPSAKLELYGAGGIPETALSLLRQVAVLEGTVLKIADGPLQLSDVSDVLAR